jgi:ketosteroid isomerase-like protein
MSASLHPSGAAAAPEAPRVQQPASPAAAASSRDTLPASSPTAAPKPDPAAADAAIRDVLRRYKSAWEARDAAALARVQQLSGEEVARVRAAMAGTADYRMDIDVQSVRVEADGRRAIAVCAITRRFRPRIGGNSEERTATNTLALEKRGDGWIITAIR